MEKSIGAKPSWREQDTKVLRPAMPSKVQTNLREKTGHEKKKFAMKL